ncbi:LSU ribosomal protein L23p [Nonlabens tegetincola]|uniref:Large ribosomal subunit protein uL23 n=1 Tax=Nonlabens tegetincola TaxID=323273 RepID=A0A090Q2Q3_9FLAO|nr:MULTISPECIES: 50S ribosomal protein L23 [Nonlabens]ALM20460.1 50S ribosomal protein L23 [Nonlabens sp. MIC269]MEE2800598.1 50S ribosomal protein L23 [Bacteroidota bacterium]PQJ19337.1 50S ribosomal protein L23 [Nonlabens tegetincola]GAK97310.1 LSU ribosomal protein L23p [Nonlabens tegetincola]
MSILLKPIITEKATNDSELLNRYGFVVSPSANKVEIKKAVEAEYGVTVLKVRTMNTRIERNVKYTKSGIQVGKTGAIKKAFVQLKDGDTIDLYSNL